MRITRLSSIHIEQSIEIYCFVLVVLRSTFKKVHVLSLRASITSDFPLNKKQTNCKGSYPTPFGDHRAIEIGLGFSVGVIVEDLLNIQLAL